MLLAPAILLAAVLAAYSNSLRGPFVFDDPASIADNPTIQSLWTSFAPPGEGAAVQNRPIVNFTLAVNYSLSRLDVPGYHAFNLAVHCVATLALFGIVRRTLIAWAARHASVNGSMAHDDFAADIARHATPLATAVALVWTIHPLQTEAVTYIIQRTESLMGMFFLLTLYCAIRGATATGKSSAAWHAASVAFCALGMGSKEVMAVAPVIVLLHDRIFLSPSWRAAIGRRKVFYAALACTWAILFAILVAAKGSRGGAAGFGEGMSWQEYALTQIAAIAHYLRLCFWPDPLVIDYGTGTITSMDQVLPAAALLAVLLAGTLVALWKAPAAGFLGAWFFLILAPSSSVIPLVTQTIAEKRMYLPLAAVAAGAVLAVYAACRCLAGKFASTSAKTAFSTALPLALLAATTISLGAGTYARNGDYSSEMNLWQMAQRDYPQNARAFSAVGVLYTQQRKFDDAVAQLDKAIELNPTNAEYWVQRGTAYVLSGRLPQAVENFSRAIELQNGYADAYDNRGLALQRLGRLNEALKDFDKAVSLRPLWPQLHVNRGGLLAAMGRQDEALAEFNKAVELRGDFAMAYYNRANTYLARGHYPQAEADYSRAIELEPNYADAYINRGVARHNLGRDDLAAADFARVVELDPGKPDGYANRANCLLGMGQYAAAVRDYSRAVELQSDYAAAYTGRAVCYYNLRQYDAAWADVRALRRLGVDMDPGFLRELSVASGHRE
jgi:tetratricopeptide (TPR) repeat protein